MVIGVGTVLLCLLGGAQVQKQPSVNDALTAISAAMASSRPISGTEAWVDVKALAVPVAKKYTDSLVYDDVAADQRAYWLPCFNFARNWPKTLEWSDRLYKQGTIVQQRDTVASSALTASLAMKDAVAGQEWYWRALDVHKENGIGIAQTLTRPLANLIDSQIGREAADNFLKQADQWQAKIARNDENRYALAVVAAEIHLTLGTIATKHGDQKASVAAWDRAMAVSNELAWIKAQTMAAITRTKMVGKPLPRLKVLAQKGRAGSLADLKGKATVVEVYGGGWSFPEVVRAPDIKSRLASGDLQYVRLVWRQKYVDGFLGIDAKDEFNLYTNSVDNALFIPVEQVKSLGLYRPGAILLDSDGAVRAFLTEPTYEALQDFLAQVDGLTTARS